MVSRIHRDPRTARMALRACQDGLRWPELVTPQPVIPPDLDRPRANRTAQHFADGVEWELRDVHSIDMNGMRDEWVWRGLPSVLFSTRMGLYRAAPCWAFAAVASVFRDTDAELNFARRKRALMRLHRMTPSERASIATVFSLGGRPAVRAVLLA